MLTAPKPGHPAGMLQNSAHSLLDKASQKLCNTSAASVRQAPGRSKAWKQITVGQPERQVLHGSLPARALLSNGFTAATRLQLRPRRGQAVRQSLASSARPHGTQPPQLSAPAPRCEVTASYGTAASAHVRAVRGVPHAPSPRRPSRQTTPPGCGWGAPVTSRLSGTRAMCSPF